MTLFDYFLLFWFSLNALMTIAAVGKRRDIIQPSTAVGAVIIYAAFIVALLFSRGVF